jgi:hypothetical protein
MLTITLDPMPAEMVNTSARTTKMARSCTGGPSLGLDSRGSSAIGGLRSGSNDGITAICSGSANSKCRLA